MTDTTMCETLGRRSARRSNCRVEECKELYKYSYNLPGAFAKTVTLSTEWIAKQERPTRTREHRHCAQLVPRKPLPMISEVLVIIMKVLGSFL